MSDTINITTTIVEEVIEITTTDNQTIVNIITQPPGTVTKTSDLINDGADGTSTFVETNELAQVATSGSYNDLTDTPTIPTTPNISQVLNISDRPVILHDVTTGDFTFDTSHIGKYIGFFGEGICDAIIPDDTYDGAKWVNLVGGVSVNCTVNFKWQSDSKSLLVGGNPTKVISFSAKLTDPTYNGWVWSVSTDELTGGEPSGRKTAIYRITGQTPLGFINVEDRFNNTGINFTFEKDYEVVGFFSIPDFDDVNQKLVVTVNKPNRECKWLTEDQKLVTYNPTTNDFVDDAFEFGGWIEIEVLTPLP